MDEHDWLAERFEQNRAHLRAVAYRLLGSMSEADDAIQETWLRLHRSDTSDVGNLPGWLTTVVSRVALDMLRSRKSRREHALDALHSASIATGQPEDDPEHEAVLADSVGAALLLVLEALTPAERLAFVLHDLFAVPFAEIAPIVGCTPTAARKLASRARHRVHGSAPAPAIPVTERRPLVDAFLAASREGDFGALLAMLDPDVIVRADRAAVHVGAPHVVRGAEAVAGMFSGRARVARPALVDGAPGAVWAPGGQPRVVFTFTVVNDRIAAIELIADAERLGKMALTVLDVIT